MTAPAPTQLPNIGQLTPQVFNYARAYVFQLMRSSEPDIASSEQALGLWIARAVVRQADRFDRQKTRRLFDALDNYVHGEPNKPSDSFNQLLTDLAATLPSPSPTPAAAAPAPEAKPETVEPPAKPETVEPPAKPETVEPPAKPEIVEAPAKPEIVEPPAPVEQAEPPHHHEPSAHSVEVSEAMERADSAPSADGYSETAAPGLDVPTGREINTSE